MATITTRTTLSDALPLLVAPFPSHLIEVKPGATTKTKERALALAYVDWRDIAERLEEAVGPEHWSCHLQPWSDTKLIARLTILGLTKESTGEGAATDENGGTSAEAQAKKRAFYEFGCRYLYRLPRLWAAYDETRKSFVNPYEVIIRMYHAAGLEDYISEETVQLARETARASGTDETPVRATRSTPTHRAAPRIAPVRSAPTASAPRENGATGERSMRERVAAARSALQQTDTTTAAPPAAAATPAASAGRPATERQLAVLRDRDQLAAAQERFGVATLEQLTFDQASDLIRALPPRRRTS